MKEIRALVSDCLCLNIACCLLVVGPWKKRLKLLPVFIFIYKIDIIIVTALKVCCEY